MEQHTFDDLYTSVRIKKLAVASIISVISIIGIIPALIALNLTNILKFYSLGAVIIIFIATFLSKNKATKSPSRLEFCFAGLSSLNGSTNIGIVLLFFYWFLYGLMQLAKIVGSFLGAQLHINSVSVAIYGSTIFVLLSGISILVDTVHKVSYQLYPNLAGVYSLLNRYNIQKNRIWKSSVIFSLLFVTACIIILLLNNWHFVKGFFIALSIYLYLISKQFFDLDTGFSEEKQIHPSRTGRTKQEIRKDITALINRLIKTVGYQSEIYPSNIDPMLGNLDIFAKKGLHNLFLNIRIDPKEDESLDWKDASNLENTGWVLSERLNLLPETSDPRLILIDAKGDRSLKKQDYAKVIKLTSAEVLRVSEEYEDPKEQIEDILKLFGLPDIKEKELSLINRVNEVGKQKSQ